MNQGDHNSSGEEVESEDSANLAELRKKLELSNMQLLELTYNDEKFMTCIDDLNSKGVECIRSEEYREAQIYFNENQKILEYAASCGKTIDRSVILSTLHNQACVNQKLWELEKSANYLEAITFNIQAHIQNSKTKIGDILNFEQLQQKQFDGIVGLNKKKQSFGLYKLQFCAVNSQIRKHDISIQSAKGSINVMKEVCDLTHHIIEIMKEKETIQFLTEIQDILKHLKKVEENLELTNYQNYIRIVKKLIKQRSKFNNSLMAEKLKHLKTFSIGKLMQLSPLMISDMSFKANKQELLKYEDIVIKALYLGISYFTVGTEMRFIASSETEENSEDLKNSETFKLSAVYHIYAIMIVLSYVPVDTIFLNHLLSSFNNHYLLDLECSQEVDREIQSISKSESKRSEESPNDADNIQLKQESSLDEEEQKKQIISPLAQKINDKMGINIMKLDNLSNGVMAKSIERSDHGFNDNRNEDNENSQKRLVSLSNELEQNRGKSEIKKNFLRSKSSKEVKIRSKNKDTITIGKKSSTATGIFFQNSNKFKKDETSRRKGKSRKNQNFSRNPQQEEEKNTKKSKDRKKVRNSNSQNKDRKKKPCIYTHKDKKDLQKSPIPEAKSNERHKKASKSLGNKSRSKKKFIQFKGIEKIASVIKRSKQKNHHQAYFSPLSHEEKEKYREANSYRIKGKQKQMVKMNKVQGRRIERKQRK